MILVTVDEVRAIISTNLEDLVIREYIESTDGIMKGLFQGVSISQGVYKEIQRWLTAHAIAISKERQAKEEGAGGAYIKYSLIQGQGLASTSYGQMAMTIDSTGILQNTIKNKRVLFDAVKEDYGN